MQSRLSRALARLALVAGSLAFCFALAEIALRVAGARPRTATVLSSFFQPDANSGWVGRPGVAMRFATSDFDVLVRHDKNGLRHSGFNTAIAEDAASDKRIVWCVGDSTTWGWGVADDQGYVALLNKMSLRDVRYRNLGVPGYSSLQEYFFLKRRFERGEKPHEVLLLFASNDPQDNLDATGSRPFFKVSDGRAMLRNHPCPADANWRFRSWLKRNSLAYNYLNYELARVKLALRHTRQSGREKSEDRSAPADNPVGASPAPPDDSDEYVALRAAYRLLQELCETHEVRLTVATPVGGDLVRGVCHDLNLPLLDVSSHLGQQTTPGGKRRPVIFPHDGHWNELGNRLVAEGLNAELERSRREDQSAERLNVAAKPKMEAVLTRDDRHKKSLSSN